MSDKSDRIEQAFGEMLERLNEVGDKASHEIPLVIEEFLHWHFMMSIISFVVSFAFMIGFCLLFRKCIKDFKEGADWTYDHGGDRIHVGISLVAISLAAVVSFIRLTKNLDWIQILVAPRVYVIENFSKLIGG